MIRIAIVIPYSGMADLGEADFEEHTLLHCGTHFQRFDRIFLGNFGGCYYRGCPENAD